MMPGPMSSPLGGPELLDARAREAARRKGVLRTGKTALRRRRDPRPAPRKGR